MIEKTTTLVLGAGASAPYGFPLGSELRQSILDIGLDALYRDQIDVRELLNFQKAFRTSRLYSIDAFLAARPEMVETGKLAIAGILLNVEHRNFEKLTAVHQDWYDYLWNRLAAGHSWDDLSFKNLSIVTFNYDRSFEQFLLISILGTYKKSSEEAAKKLAELSIVHVYGDIGSAFPQSPDYQPYGAPVDAKRMRFGASRLKVIPEAREDEPSIKQAQDLLLNAETICFLGFGFDRTNMARLDSKRTCYPFSSSTRKSIAASCYGLTPAEAAEAAHLCGFNFQGHWETNFIDGDCLQTLRKTLILR